MTSSKPWWFALAASLLLASCATGYSPTPYWTIREASFGDLKPGVTTKEEVRKLIGTPLIESHFPRQGDEVWDYRYLQGTTIVMMAYVYFDSKGVFKYSRHMRDPAFYSGRR